MLKYIRYIRCKKILYNYSFLFFFVKYIFHVSLNQRYLGVQKRGKLGLSFDKSGFKQYLSPDLCRQLPELFFIEFILFFVFFKNKIYDNHKKNKFLSYYKLKFFGLKNFLYQKKI